MRSLLLNRSRGFVPLAALLLLAEAGWIGERYLAARSQARELSARQQELRRLVLEADASLSNRGVDRLAHLELQVRTAQAQWQESGPLVPTPAPASRAEAFFELAKFVEEMRELARQEGVAVAPGERFGFAAYAHAGPPPELAVDVARQRATLRAILPLLFQAHPARLTAVRRTQPQSTLRSDLARGEPGIAAERDSFDASQWESALVKEGATVDGFQLVFAGETAALREFLNTVAQSDLPMVVESVEAEPWSGAERSAAGGGRESQFTLTLIRVELPPLPTEVAAK